MKKYLIFSLLFLTVIISGCSSKQTKDKVSFCTSSTGKVMTYERALEIAKASSCAKVGSFTGEYGCNNNSGGMINVVMDPINHPGCGFACRVSIDKEVAEEGWM